MRKYITKIKLIKNNSQCVGAIGEHAFRHWFRINYQDETLHKQLKDRDQEGVDFSCNKGYTYQVKTTAEKTYTFNCPLKNLSSKLTCDFYVLIQIKDGYVYIENIYKKDYILSNAKSSYHYGNTFLWAKDLKTKEVDLNQLRIKEEYS